MAKKIIAGVTITLSLAELRALTEALTGTKQNEQVQRVVQRLRKALE